MNFWGVRKKRELKTFAELKYEILNTQHQTHKPPRRRHHPTDPSFTRIRPEEYVYIYDYVSEFDRRKWWMLFAFANNGVRVHKLHVISECCQCHPWANHIIDALPTILNSFYNLFLKQFEWTMKFHGGCYFVDRWKYNFQLIPTQSRPIIHYRVTTQDFHLH